MFLVAFIKWDPFFVKNRFVKKIDFYKIFFIRRAINMGFKRLPIFIIKNPPVPNMVVRPQNRRFRADLVVFRPVWVRERRVRMGRFFLCVCWLFCHCLCVWVARCHFLGGFAAKKLTPKRHNIPFVF